MFPYSQPNTMQLPVVAMMLADDFLLNIQYIFRIWYSLFVSA